MSTPEYLEYRCCMCPNIDTPEATECPAGHACRFVKIYVDKRGWLYKVRAGLGGHTFSGFYLKPGKTSWKSMKQLPWRDSFDSAQADLNKYAHNKGWGESDLPL